MIVATSRFGNMEVDESRLLHFPQGILGFPDQSDYALIQTSEDSDFYWLQAVGRPELAFVVCDPRLMVPDYRVPIKAEDLEQIDLDSPDGAQVFVIVNKIDETLTGNLQGPLIINTASRIGRQLVLSDRRFSTRYPLIKLPGRQEPVSKTA